MLADAPISSQGVRGCERGAWRPGLHVALEFNQEKHAFGSRLRSSEKQRAPAVKATLTQCARKLEAIERGGLGHLALGRATVTLSGGELQRLKISRSLAGGLANACFILDACVTNHSVLDESLWYKVLSPRNVTAARRPGVPRSQGAKCPYLYGIEILKPSNRRDKT